MKVYLGKQESIGAVKVPVDDGSDEYTELRGMIKLAMYVKKEDFPDVMDFFEKWMWLYRSSTEGIMPPNGRDSLLSDFSNQLHSMANGFMKLADKQESLAKHYESNGDNENTDNVG